MIMSLEKARSERTDKANEEDFKWRHKAMNFERTTRRAIQSFDNNAIYHVCDFEFQ